ncbi:MAG: hypothetical protein GKR92_07725 [Gammaproteobacteria bacterium]|nr:MAG: hypothetical protein GKR92_07725 [Gammaproteobacteria bacterium]
MIFKKLPVKYIDGKSGVYAISPNISDKNTLLSWIQNKNFEKFVNGGNQLLRHTRKRNKLYTFQHPIFDKQVILKVSEIDKQYKLTRRVNLYLSTLLNDYNFRAFSGACLLRENDITCPEPIAYWNEKHYFLIKKSYYLYEMIEADNTVHSFAEKLSAKRKSSLDEIQNVLANKIVRVVQSIHSAGYRQGDPHPGNFLISNFTKKISELTTDEINQAQISIIDLDKFSNARINASHIKLFFDVRCFRRCTLGKLNQQDMLKIYMGNKHSKLWAIVLEFWMLGGFNFTKWFKFEKKRK